LDIAVDIVLVADVRDDGDGTRYVFGPCAQLLRITIHHDDPGAGRAEPRRDHQAEARSRSRHDRHLAVEVPLHPAHPGSRISAIAAPTSVSSSSATRIRSSVPAVTARISTVALAVSISASTSSWATESPSAFSHRTMVASAVPMPT